MSDKGVLSVADGLHVQPVPLVWQSIVDRWGVPVRVVCDRFRLGELEDAIQGACPVEPVVWQWSSASSDIRSLRKLVKDGPLSIDESSRLLLAVSLAAAKVENDSSGNSRIVKRSRTNQARDDIAVALTLAAGAFERASSAPVREMQYAVV